jgi:hypothetical protein
MVGKIRLLEKWINRRSICAEQLSGSLFGKRTINHRRTDRLPEKHQPQRGRNPVIGLPENPGSYRVRISAADRSNTVEV